jgi:signal transduction histidine kinase
VRTNGVLRDEEPLRDLVRAEMLVEEQQDLDLACRERPSDRLGDPVEAPAFADTVEQPPGDPARERRLAPRDTAQERRDLLGRLGLEQIAGGSAADRREQVLLRVGGGQHDDLALRRLVADAREGGQAVHAGHGQVEEDEIGLELARRGDRLLAARRVPDHLEALLREKGGESIPRQGMVVDEQDALGHLPLIGTGAVAEKRGVEHLRSQSYRSWLVGEVLLIGLLASATGFFAVSESLQSAYELPETRLVLDTGVAVVAGIVAVLASIRFLVDGRTLDLLLAGGFWSISLGTTAFGLVPVLGGDSLPPWAAWALVGSRLLGAGVIAVAPWASGRLSARRSALFAVGLGIVAILASAGIGLRTPTWDEELRTDGLVENASVMRAAVLLAILWLIALVGFFVRYRRHGRDLDSWMCLSATLALFAELHLVLTPVVSSEFVLQGDFLRLIAYGVLLVGVWRAIADAEFGRAVADERARVAREIHDGLAQYLFAITTQVSMLESGAPLQQVLPRLKRASTAAQQEARFAVLALSSAGGSARFDSALRRYVDVLTADGELDVELDVDGGVRLAPDEQIEVFRIVQEGLGNARRHAGARHVEVAISQRAGRRIVSVRDDGVGFDEETVGNGQGLENMRQRAAAIEGQLSLSSAPGRGTAIEVVLRPT